MDSRLKNLPITKKGDFHLTRRRFGVMPYKVLTPISGEPTYKNMKLMKKELRANLISVKTPTDWSRGKGFIF